MSKLDDSLLEEGEYSEGEEGEEEGEIPIPEVVDTRPKYEQLGFSNEEEHKKVTEEFRFFDKNLDDTIPVSDVEKLIRILLSTKNRIYESHISKKAEPVIEEVKEVEEKVDETLAIEEEGEEKEEEEEPEEVMTIDEFCILFNEIKKFKSLNHAENELIQALKLFDRGNNNVVEIHECLRNNPEYNDILPEEKQDVQVTDFLELLKENKFLTKKISTEEKKKEKLVELKKFYFDDYMKKMESSESEDEDSDEDEGEEDEENEKTEKLSQEERDLIERRKSKLYRSLFYMDYTYVPKKKKRERQLKLKIENSLLTRVSREGTQVKALDEKKQGLVLDFLEEYDFLNDDRFLGERPDVTLEANHFVFRDGVFRLNENNEEYKRDVRMMILRDCKLFNTELDSYICSFL